MSETGSYSDSGFDYRYSFQDGKRSITVRIDGVKEADALTLEVDEEFEAALEAVLEKFSVRKWDGFSKSNKNVLDGTSFRFSVRFDDKHRIFAHGYMRFPSDYNEVKAEMEELFLTKYEEIRPDRKKVMDKYFKEVILKDCIVLEKQEAIYRYISAGGNRFRRGRCDCTGGAVMYPVYSVFGEPEYMLVIYLTEYMDKWLLSCEIYKIDEKGKVEPWGKAEVDSDFFCSDRLYGHVFTRQHNGELQLGVFTQKGYSASDKDTEYSIDLYDIDNKLKPLANKKIEGPRDDKQWWTRDKIADFIEIADTFGFWESKQHWEQMPSDPVFASGIKDQSNHRLDYIATNNLDGSFCKTLTVTPEGQPVGDYHVSVKLYVK